MRDLINTFLIGIAICFAQLCCSAEQYKLVVIPDNIVTDTAAVDSYIYNATAEFFATEVINILNQTDFIKTPTVSDERDLLKSNPSSLINARELTNRFKNTYNVDFTKLKKLSQKNQARYVLMLTTAIDSENYILRRTLWDFLNIAGATVIDPAYKLSTYAVLVDTSNNNILWSNTFYKTISVVESRILTRGPSPQTEQLQKIRDYSRMICPEIAQNVQLKVLPPEIYEKESNKIYYDIGNFDNIFTKKHRRWTKERKKVQKVIKNDINTKVTSIKENRAEKKRLKAEKAARKYEQKMEQQKIIKDVKAEEYKVNSDSPTNLIQPLEDDSIYEPISIKRHKKNTLYGEYNSDRPQLRGYDKL